MMEASQYRRDFATFNSKIELAHYKYRAGLDVDLRVSPIYERYGELFSREAVEYLRTLESNTSSQPETEKTGVRMLLGAACIGFLDTQIRDLTEECARKDVTAYIKWEGENLSSFSVPKILASESSHLRRRELYSRFIDSVLDANDHRVARVESLHQSARKIGFESYRALYTNIQSTDFEVLANRADAFLERTEATYRNSLARVVARDLPGVTPDNLHHADYYYFQRKSSLDKFFPAGEVITTYQSAMKGIGVRTEQQTNIYIDCESRPTKHPRASCLRVNPPDDVRLIIAPIGGAHDYMTLFHEAGHAQHLGWTSRDLMTTHPEFVYSPDYATTEGFAFLFNHLFHDPRWLQEYRPGISAEQAQSIVRDLALLTTYTIRRFCAKLRYDIVLHDSVEVGPDRLAETYATLQASATGFARSPALYLSDVDDGFYSAAYLRAWVFEAGLREYLRTRYGYRWWVSRKAGDELIDLWSTSSRYSVEELARLLGMGELDYDFLAESWIASMTEGE